jgi:hypothetical protein
MIINPSFRRCVSFLSLVIDGEESKIRYCGSSFIVYWQKTQNSGSHFLVTARHNLEECRAIRGTLIANFNLSSGGIDKIELPESHWTSHPSTDVAAFPIHLKAEYDCAFLERHHFFSNREYPVNAVDRVDVGDDIFYIGLFSPHTGATQFTPLSRFGKIALTLGKVPVKFNSGSLERSTDAYLIEAQSWGGASGSPVFHRKWPTSEAQELAFNDPTGPKLIGLLQGHFNFVSRRGNQTADWAQLSDSEQAKMEMNSGIGIVIPTSAIAETLNEAEREERGGSRG